MLQFVPGDKHQAVLLDGESLEEVYKFKYLGSMFVANGQGSEAGLILLVPHSLACNPVFDRGVQRAGFTSQQ